MAKRTKRAREPQNGVVSISETPLCIRFKPGDLDRVADAAARDGVLRSVWIREAAIERAEQILGGMEVEPLAYETAGGIGDQVCIRFRPDDFKRIQRAAAREKALPSPWIRAVVMSRVDQMLPKKGTNGHGERRSAGGEGTASRLRVKNGSSSDLPVLGKSRRAASRRA